MSLKTTKPACSVEPFTLDYAPFYSRHGLDPLVDLITSSVWEVIGGAKGAEGVATPKTSVFLDGGTVGSLLIAKNTIQINGGTYQTCGTLHIRVTG
jgi:hypothetical protein